MIKQFLPIGFYLISLNIIAMDGQKQKPIMDTRQQIQLMSAGLTHRMSAPDDVFVEIHSSTPSRVILDVESHVQMLRRRNMWASDDARLRMFDNDSQEDESCFNMARRCGEQTVLHCMSLQSMAFHFDLLRLLRTHFNQ